MPEAPPTARHLLGRAATVAVVAGIGPTLMATVEPGHRPGTVAAAAVLGASMAATAAGRPWWGRLAVATAAGLVAMVLDTAYVGAWLAFALIVADWIVWGRPPLPGAPAPATSLRPPLAVVAAPSLLVPVAAWGALPLAVATGAAVLALLGCPSGRTRHAALASTLVLGVAGGLLVPVFAALPTSFWILGMVVATTIHLDRSLGHGGARWTLRRHGPLALAAPSLLVLWALTCTWATGLGEGDAVGYRAFRAGLSAYPLGLEEALALTTTPSVILALLGIGAHAAAGRPTVARAATVLVILSVMGATAIALGWSLSYGA